MTEPMNEFHHIHSAYTGRPLCQERQGQQIALSDNAWPDGGHTPPCWITRAAGIHESSRARPSLAGTRFSQLQQAQWALDETAQIGRSLPFSLRDVARTSLKAHRFRAHGH